MIPSFLSDHCFSCRYNSPSVQQRLGGGRCVIPSRHGQKGGRRHDGRYRGQGGYLLQGGDDGGRVGLRDAESLRQCHQGTGGGIAEGAQHGQEDMNPLIGFALDHAEQAPLYHLQGIGLQVGE